MYLHKNISYKIIGLCMEIHNEYSYGQNERIYHSLVKEKLELNKINFSSQLKIPVYSKKTGKKIGLYIPDYIIEDKIILELKAKPFNRWQDENQLFEYLKTTNYEVGYLINFGLPSLYFKRFIFTNDRKTFICKTQITTY